MILNSILLIMAVSGLLMGIQLLRVTKRINRLENYQLPNRLWK